MLSLNQQTRRVACRLLFLAGCLMPTLAVAACAVWRALPAHVRASERDLSDQLGLPVRVGSVSHPRPGQIVYDGVQLIDPETGEPWCRARWVRTVRHAARIAVEAGQLEIDRAGQGRLRRTLERWWDDDGLGGDIVFRCGEVTLQGASQAGTLTNVQAVFHRPATGAAATLEFRVVGLEMTQPVKMRLARIRTSGGTETLWNLDTGPTAVPCALFDALMPAVAHLGPEAEFSGTIAARHSIAGWQAAVAGQLDRLDLYHLITARFPHRLNGTARLLIDDARFAAGRLQSASGELMAGPGVVDDSLLDAAVSSLGAPRPRVTSSAESLIPYEQLAVRFAIDEQGLRLAGQCGTAGSGQIMVDRGGVLLADPPRQPVPVVALVRTLVPDNAVQVPATRETEPLVGWLPVPSIERSPDDDGESTPTGRILRGPR